MTKRVAVLVMLVLGVLVGSELVHPLAAHAHACACRDLNDDGVCDGSDTAIDDSEWLGGTAFVDNVNTFLIPSGCDHTLATVPTGGVRVTARRVVIGGTLALTPTGGAGVLFTALQDVVLLPGSQIIAGGFNNLSQLLPANIAIARASVGFKAGTTCTLRGTSLQGNPVTGFGQIGIQCGLDIVIEGSNLLAAGIDIQSLNGRILGGSSAGPSLSLLPCDDPAQNGSGKGNNNGIVDDGDFPCTVTFEALVGLSQVANFCSPPNTIRTVNNPLVMISRGDLDFGHPGPGHVLAGLFRVQLYSEDGDVDVSHATIANALPPGSAAGGAFIEIAANPSSVKRQPFLQVSATGPFSGEIDITGACFISAQAVRLRGTTTGTPAPAGCLPGSATTSLAAGVAAICDAAGNQNGMVDIGDFPCSVTFSGSAADALASAQNFCGEPPSEPGKPDVAISKIDSPDPVVPGGELTYLITVQNVSGTTANDVVITDPLPAGTSFISCVVSQGSCSESSGTVTANIGTLAPGASAVLTLKVSAPQGDPCGPITNVATVTATNDSNAANNTAQAVTQCAPRTGGEGCTPGYWKAPQHFDSWPAPLTPQTLFSAVFENAFPNRTLRQVLSLGGGGLNALGRHTAAALLSASSPGVDYALTAAEVIAMFNAVFPGGDYEALKNVFEGFNEQGCPLN